MDSTAILILAAGLGKRMGMSTPKVLAKTSEGALVQHVVQTADALMPEKIIVVTGHQRELVENAVRDGARTFPFKYELSRIESVVQKKQQGTGDAVRAALPLLADFKGTVLILYGDVPLLRPHTLRYMLEEHWSRKATITVTSALTDSPGHYGRVIRSSETGMVEKIVEASDCSELEKLIQEVNLGIYAVDSSFLGPAIEGLTNENVQQEYLLTDIISRASGEGQTIASYILSDLNEAQGVNTVDELISVNNELRRRRVERLMRSGVHVEDPTTLYIDPSVKIDSGVSIGPNVQLRGETRIEKGVKLEGSAYLLDTIIHADAFIKFGVRAEGAEIGKRAMVGPFAHLRPGTKLSDEVKVGNFVETKNSTLEKGAKASHLSYLGDCSVGEQANVGAGTITCNYDGYKKSHTEVGAGAFIGSNTSLIAPVSIGKGATVGAGSVITKDISADALAVTRADQKEVSGWSKKKRERLKTKK